MSDAAGGVLGYAQQVTKCCNCSGFIQVMDAANQLLYTIEGDKAQCMMVYLARRAVICTVALTIFQCIQLASCCQLISALFRALLYL